jgi:hypothetical protein
MHRVQLPLPVADNKGKLETYARRTGRVVPAVWWPHRLFVRVSKRGWTFLAALKFFRRTPYWRISSSFAEGATPRRTSSKGQQSTAAALPSSRTRPTFQVCDKTPTSGRLPGRPFFTSLASSGGGSLKRPPRASRSAAEARRSASPSLSVVASPSPSRHLTPS